jgi:predicted ATPase
MKITSMRLTDFSPIKHFAVDDLGSTIIIAGANGSGKTRLKDAIVSTIQGNALMDMTIRSTRPEEEVEKYFNGNEVKITKGTRRQELTNYINSRSYGSSRYVGSLVQIDSKRSVQSLKYTPVNWLGGDPDDVDGIGNYYFSAFTNRWQQFVNYIHQKSAARDKKLAEVMKSNPSQTGTEILIKNPDPFEKYQKIFKETLPGKELLDINPASPAEFRYKAPDGLILPFSSLSSGEQEIIKILFDVARKDIRHSIIIVDEPELHLHPTLASQLIESLKAIGDHTNQYIFLTHSSDLISTYYSTGDVYFIDPSQTGGNQAHRLGDIVNEHPDLVKVVGQNLGLFAVGKKLVFVEGEDASIDRLSYQKIAQRIDPEIRILPVGSVLNLMALNNIEQQIRQTVFGIELYMVRDRDGLSAAQISKLGENGRVRVLKRRHIENYFLDPQVLFEVATRFYIDKKFPELSADYINDKILSIVRNSIPLNIMQNTREYISLNFNLVPPSVRNVHKKTRVETIAELVESMVENTERIASCLDQRGLHQWISEEANRLEKSLVQNLRQPLPHHRRPLPPRPQPGLPPRQLHLRRLPPRHLHLQPCRRGGRLRLLPGFRPELPPGRPAGARPRLRRRHPAPGLRFR